MNYLNNIYNLFYFFFEVINKPKNIIIDHDDVDINVDFITLHDNFMEG